MANSKYVMMSLSRARILLLIVVLHTSAVLALIPRDVVIVVLSQDKFQTSQAIQLKDELWNQARDLDDRAPSVHLIHQEFPHPGAWTVLPLLRWLNILHGRNSSWLFFCESYTKINLKKLLEYLEKFDSHQSLWIGHAVYDREPTIIHHYAFSADSKQFKYPYFGSGFAVSYALLETLSHRLDHEDLTTIDFSIDASYELALFIGSNDIGPKLTHADFLCLSPKPQCASFTQNFQPCGDPVKKTSVYFGVKTCSKFHEDRIPVLKKTWAKYATHIGLYSDRENASIPTIDLGIPNTETGHCHKTLAILNDAILKAKDIPDLKWVIITDDDTILSVARILQLLSCFDPPEGIALGERYGYNIFHPHLGYNYITGGGGMVFSIDVASSIVQSNVCECPSPSTPDDMFLGVCLARLGVPIIHSPAFHQARPADYPPEYLFSQQPVSFHKHSMNNPVKVYNDWFAAADQQMETSQADRSRSEL